VFPPDAEKAGRRAAPHAIDRVARMPREWRGVSSDVLD
jgi:hypothetical protein